MDSRRQLAALARVLRLLDRRGIDSWLFGGWAVDFHLGVVTRTHADLDLAVWASDLERIAALLLGDGWSHAPEEGEDGYTGYERYGVRVGARFPGPARGRPHPHTAPRRVRVVARGCVRR